MQNARITLHGRKGDKKSHINVHLSFDIPEEIMKILVNELCKGVERWEDRIILHGKLTDNDNNSR